MLVTPFKPTLGTNFTSFIGCGASSLMNCGELGKVMVRWRPLVPANWLLALRT
jgi:hypothetical protein